MNNESVATSTWSLIIILTFPGIMSLGGCSGDPDSVGFGGARGYAYQSATGGSILISASPNPPAGYQPVPANTVVRIEGYPELQTFTLTDGFYYIPIIPVGSQVLVLEAPSGTLSVTIPIVANRITEGGGHSEGGGGGGGGGDDPGMTTFTQGGWGAAPRGNNAGKLLADHFAAAFPNGVRLGVPYGVTFTSPQQITDFLPQDGTPGVWTTNQTLPIRNSTAGSFAGQVLALQLSVGFSMAGITPSGLADLKVTKGPYTGYKVSELLILAQRVLGSEPTVTLPTSLPALNEAVTACNENFDNGAIDRGFLR